LFTVAVRRHIKAGNPARRHATFAFAIDGERI